MNLNFFFMFFSLGIMITKSIAFILVRIQINFVVIGIHSSYHNSLILVMIIFKTIKIYTPLIMICVQKIYNVFLLTLSHSIWRAKEAKKVIRSIVQTSWIVY